MTNVEKVADTMANELGFKLLRSDAYFPTKGHATDSGHDLYAVEDTLILPGDTVLVETGVAVDLPSGIDGTNRPRSGVSAKSKARVILGTIDNGYTGEIKVITDNTNPDIAHAVRMKRVLEATTKALFRAAGVGMASQTMVNDALKDTFEKEFYVREVQLLDGTTIPYIATVPVGTILVRRGDKIAQLAPHDYYISIPTETKETSGERGDAGFGSTGVNANV